MLGQSLLHYQITAKLGQGGMGEVYRATDTKLDREVAIKILPAVLSQDKERLARFEREAKVLAQLNHSNISTVHGFDRHEGTAFLVMEYVVGEDLSERLRRGPMPIDEAIAICRQVAEGLEAAHGKGIIHRDLKPANIKVTSEGQVKVLDFGLAKAMEADGEGSPYREEALEDSPTITDAFTRPGTILGTAAYMSPEQAKGKALDERSDIWAFGCVLYECLTGRRAFEAEDSTETLAAIVRGETDWTLLPREVPPLVTLVLQQCLAKDLKRRLRDIGDARLFLEQTLEGSISADTVPANHVSEAPQGWMRFAWPAVALISLLGWMSTSLLAPRPDSIAQSVSGEHVPVSRRVLMDLDRNSDLSLVGEIHLSPDGSLLAFAGSYDGSEDTELFLRKMDQLQARKMSVEESFTTLCFSPDGSDLAVFVPGEQAIKRVSVSGGDSFILCRTTEDRELLYGLDWGEGDRIVFSTGAADGIQEVKASGSGGVARVLTQPEEPYRFHRWPKYLPDGRGVLFSADRHDGPFNHAEIMVFRAADGTTMPLGIRGHHPHYLPSGHLVYVRGSGVFGVRFDLDQLEVRGDEQPLFKGLSEFWGIIAWGFARNGDLVYRPEFIENRRVSLEWVDQDGERSSALPIGIYDWFKISPDGDWLIYSDELERIRIVNLETKAPKTIRGEPRGAFPVWGPKGEWVMWAGQSGNGETKLHEAVTNLYLDRLGDFAEAVRVVPSDQLQVPTAWGRDGSQVLFFTNTDETTGDLLALDMARTSEMTWRVGGVSDFRAGPAYQDYAQFSPDGNWVTYISNELGRAANLWVSRFDSPEETKRPLTEGGVVNTFSQWLGEDELLYLNDEFVPQPPLHRIQRLRYTTEGGEFRWEHLEPWPNATTVHHFAVDPDGTRLLVQKLEELPDPGRINKQVVLFSNFAQYVEEQIGAQVD